MVSSTKMNLYCSSTLSSPEFLSAICNKAKLFAKIFSEKSNCYNLGSSLPVFTSRANLKLFRATTNMADLDSFKAFGLDRIPVVI